MESDHLEGHVDKEGFEEENHPKSDSMAESSELNEDNGPINDYQASLQVKVPQYRVYPVRFVMLAALIILNLSNGMMWLSYAPIPQYTSDYYGISLSDVDWFSQSYFVTSLVVGFISIAILDIFGLRTAVILGTCSNLIGAILRYVSTLEPIVCSTDFPKAGFSVAMIGQILTACAQPFFLYAPAKLANTWFGPKERGICTDLASIANPIGLAIAQLVSPHVVTETYKLPTLMWIYIIPAGVGLVFSFAFYRSSPPVPPTPSGDIEHLPFFKGLKDTLLNCNFWVLLFVWGLAAGVMNALLIILPQVLCPYGYSDQDVGLWGSLLLFFGLIGATVSGILIGITKRFKEIGVGGFTLAILTILWFTEVAYIENQPYLVSIPLCLFGIFALSLLPICMELGVEVTYPVAEATSSGLLWSSAQIFGMIFVIICQAIATDIDSPLSNNQCGLGSNLNANSTITCSNHNGTSVIQERVKPQNWTNGGLLLVGAATAGYILFVLLFKPTYKRLHIENKLKN